MHHLRKPGWAIPEHEATPEAVFMDRRRFLMGALGVLAGGIVGGTSVVGAAEKTAEEPADRTMN
ncbi:MAG: protein-methionine-sulfoxide reductase catalytic subunit MsrP, partial [Candidatus Methylomirabilales bacterium]